MFGRSHLLAWVTAAAVLRPLPVMAQLSEPPPRHRLAYEAAVAARYNPLGLFLFGNLSYRARLYRSDSVALLDNHASFGLAGALSPAFGRIGFRADLQPLSILRLSATYLYGAYFGTFGNLQSYASPDGDWSDSAREAAEGAPDPNERPYASHGHQLQLAAQLQLKVGDFVLRDTFVGQWTSYRLRPGDTGYYDPVLDTLVPNGGFTLTNDLDLLYLVPGSGLMLGARYNWTRPLYTSVDWASDPDATQSYDNVIQRVGPLFGYTFEGTGDRFTRPTLLLLLQWYAVHRFRTGEDVSRAVPYVGLALLTKGDLYRHGD